MAKNFDCGSIQISIVDNSEAIREALQNTALRTLTRWGETARDTAMGISRRNTGALANSIAFSVDPEELSVTVGSSSEYAIYNEMGTGKHKEGGGGRPTPWVYKGADGKYYRTEGMKPKPFIRPAFTENMSEFERIAKEEFGG